MQAQRDMSTDFWYVNAEMDMQSFSTMYRIKKVKGNAWNKRNLW